MKKILGLDLGTTSIGWAFVEEAEGAIETSDIITAGVRINPLSTDEKTDFEKGAPFTLNQERTKNRGDRRLLDRYQQRRRNLITTLQQAKVIPSNFQYAETGVVSTYQTLALRSQAAIQKIALEDFAKVLLIINKKRGYKSNRKAKAGNEGQLIDGMEVAKILFEKKQTPGQYAYELLQNNQKSLPTFYSSDLQKELEAVWAFQNQFYPEILTEEFKKQIAGKGKEVTQEIFLGKYEIFTAENKGIVSQQALHAYEWRAKSVHTQLSIEELASVIVAIQNDLNQSSKYLAAISDRSKELYFNNRTVGQYQYDQLHQNPHYRLKGQVHYRQDYIDEFEQIWKVQAEACPEILTEELKNKIQKEIIFYQRPLKSQKHLVSVCQFELHHKTIPRSSPLFQQGKIWETLNNFNYRITGKRTKIFLTQQEKEQVFEILNLQEKITGEDVLKILNIPTESFSTSFENVHGNDTNSKLYNAYAKIVASEDGKVVEKKRTQPRTFIASIRKGLEALGIDSCILDFNPTLVGNAFAQQKSYELWHSLYSIDNEAALKRKLIKDFGFPAQYADVLINIDLKDKYGSLSAKALRKIYPFLEAGNRYDEAVGLAGYGSHSNVETATERDARHLDAKLEIIKKNKLRNPIVEKILNQMINLVNEILANPTLGKPDEIRVELARDLKLNAKKRRKKTKEIAENTKKNEAIKALLMQPPFSIKNPTQNDIVRYRLYQELKTNGYKTLYSMTYIAEEKLFSKEFDIDHIIPQAYLMDDSFSNKTLETVAINREKGKRTAIDFMRDKYGEKGLAEYEARVAHHFKVKQKNKYTNLMTTRADIPDGFVKRDLRDTQYISLAAKNCLAKIVRVVTSTTGSVTARLREDWGLVDIMKEINLDKYKQLEHTELKEKKDGSMKEVIIGWSKRDDHRHHVMDAITVAFTKPSFIQYLNYLNAKDDPKIEHHENITYIEDQELYTDKHSKHRFKVPMPQFRQKAKEVLDNVLVSFKTKSRVTTKNTNKIKTSEGIKSQPISTPRGSLNKDTFYSIIQQYTPNLEAVNSSFTKEKINQVANKSFREALLQRLAQYGNDSTKAFTGKNALAKNPLYIDEKKIRKVPEKVKLLTPQKQFVMRKPIDMDLKIGKVIDKGVKRILQKRLDAYGGDPKKAFVDLDKNPIWLNEEKGIAIKRVTISGVANAEALHYKKDHFGRQILDATGKPIPVDFVQTGNNHHVAIYRDEKGSLQEEVVSFFEAVERTKQGLPIINKNHPNGWEFLFTMKQNEMFIFSGGDFNANEIDLFDPKNRKEISKRLFRVQKISSKDYLFTHHLQSKATDGDLMKFFKNLKGVAYHYIQTPEKLKNLTKVRLNHLGEIVQVGEY